MKWRVEGADRNSGEDFVLEVEADDEGAARSRASRRGMLVVKAAPVAPVHAHVERVAAAPVHARVERVAAGISRQPIVAPRTTALGAGGLFVITTLAVASGLTLALFAYYLLFVATWTPNVQGVTSSTSKLSPTEQAFVQAVEARNDTLVREYLVMPLDWKAVATPGLCGIVRDRRLSSWSYEGVEEKREREFWRSLAERLIENGGDTTQALAGAHDVESLKFFDRAQG